MFRCERCGTGFDALRTAGREHCPRCLRRDKAKARLAFTAFESRRAGESRLPMPTQARRGETEGLPA